MKGKSPEIWGDGEQTRDLVYIDDVVKMIIKSAEIDYSGILNIGTGRSISFKDIVEKIKKILNSKVDPVFIPKKGIRDILSSI